MPEHNSYQLLSPLDGRYRQSVEALAEFLSEGGLNRARIRVEVGWLLFLWEQGVFGLTPPTPEQKQAVQQIADRVDDAALAEIGEIEAVTQHDVKAVEYFIRRRLAALGLSQVAELTHFACTSEDINNLAYALNIQAALRQVWLPALERVIDKLRQMARELAEQPMLSRTHGQAATPTTMGKELAVFAYRLQRQQQQLDWLVREGVLGKFSGATGTFSAHLAADAEVPWQQWARRFVTGLGLRYNPLTTQIESHDWQSEIFARVSHTCRILHNLATDMWTYISLGYFRQQTVKGAVGSSTMPHKVNPIRFENAEANLELAGSLLDGLAASLTTSRLQRDLTDSSSQRNIGVAFGHALLALDNLRRGLDSLELDARVLAADLDNTWEVLTEAIQTVIRAEILAGNCEISDPYDLLKNFSRGQAVTAASLREFIAGLPISAAARERLAALTPAGYCGMSAALVAQLDAPSSAAAKQAER